MLQMPPSGICTWGRPTGRPHASSAHDTDVMTAPDPPSRVSASPGVVLLCLVVLTLATPFRRGMAADTADIDIGDGCMAAECHGAMLDRTTVHSAVKMELCEGCHVPPNDTHEFEPVPDPPELCYDCHDEWTGEYVHGIVEAGECFGCHDPHGSNVPGLLFAEDSVVETCTQCHDHPAEEFEYPHGPARDGRCLDCHEPHVSKYPKNLNRINADLCLTCHSKTQQRKPGPHVRREDGLTVRNIGAIKAKAKYLHAPFNMGECLRCHGPHGGISRPSLRKNFPPDTYGMLFSLDAYELCFQCHDTKIVTEKYTTETTFRRGTENLHYKHVNQDKSRSCRICHDPHGTNLPRMLREEVHFGTWTFPLDYQQTPTGGRCWPGCHREQTYDRSPETSVAQEASLHRGGASE